MTIADSILGAFGAEEEVTNAQICERTGFDLVRVCTYMGRLREMGHVEHVDGRHRPVKHRLAGAAKLRAQGRAVLLASTSGEQGETIVDHAKRSQPFIASVFRQWVVA